MQNIIAGLRGPQLGDALGGLPVGHARIVQPSGDEHGGVVLSLDVRVAVLQKKPEIMQISPPGNNEGY